MTFGQKIKKLRSEEKITQKDLAEKLNVTFQTISKWEGDINEPDFASVRELAKIFHCSIEYLISCDEEEKKEEKEEQKNESRKKLVIGICRQCGRRVYQGEQLHHIEKEYLNGRKEKINLCHTCFLGPSAIQEKEEEKQEEEHDEEIPEEDLSTKLVIGICRSCGKKVYEGAMLHHVERKQENGKVEKIIMCDSCFQNGGKPVVKEKQKEKEKKAKENKTNQKKTNEKKRRIPQGQAKKKRGLFGSFLNKKDQKALKWGMIVSSALLALFIYSGIVGGLPNDQILPFIGGTILIVYGALSTIYCIFGDTIVNRLFLEVVIKFLYVKFPGLIFTFSLDGFLWLLGMKLLFKVISIFLAILGTMIGFFISSFLSFFMFIPIMIKKKKDSSYEEKVYEKN